MIVETFVPSTTAIADSTAISALVGILPLLVFFVLLGVFKLATHWCAVGALVVAAISAVVGFGMPAGMVGLSALQGLAFGIAPILYIVIAAVWLYNLTVRSGRAEDVRAVFSAVGKGDQRVQALLVGYSFCALLEGLAGFGAPVAIVAAMLVTLGVKPLKAAAVTMVGNSINVGFGAMAIPVTTAGRIGGVPATEVAATASSITPWIATLLPFLLVIILDGTRGLRQLWHIALVQGLVMSAGHIIAANFISYELTAVFAALLSFAAVALLLNYSNPTTPEEYRSETSEKLPSGSRITLALMPYWLVVIIFAVAKLWRLGVDIPAALASTDITIEWPGLYGNLLTASGEVSESAIYNLQTLSSPGTMIVLTALIVAFVYGRNSSGGVFEFSFVRGVKVLGETIVSLRWSLLTIALVMSLAYVMNFSGQTMAIGAALAATGAAFAFLSPILGWIGTAVTGSATSANALFADLQATAAAGANLDSSVLLSANTIGGGIGKIVSPQNLAIAATAVGGKTSESEILKKVAPWSLGILLLLCVLVFLATQGILPLM
ncbi:L-lactate permease [Flaviflexus ciconiae]|uniref:L-lactate permease n=1 Tax=Flaviflexus ciconiae TaxID=2496867 RepID=A0A3Q9G9R9_9ACTO|nr:lactate permease LctP family transporter [Flaviflexus ciconiae]AZQ78255.1 L-lactate permease [Flaviflexus ciconiae]